MVKLSVYIAHAHTRKSHRSHHYKRPSYNVALAHGLARPSARLSVSMYVPYTGSLLETEQESWANAHETRDHISLILYAGCLALSPVISAKIHFKCASQLKITKNSLKKPYFGVQGRSRSSMLLPPESSSAVLVIICSKSVSIASRSYARRANSGKITIS